MPDSKLGHTGQVRRGRLARLPEGVDLTLDVTDANFSVEVRDHLSRDLEREARARQGDPIDASPPGELQASQPPVPIRMLGSCKSSPQHSLYSSCAGGTSPLDSLERAVRLITEQDLTRVDLCDQRAGASVNQIFDRPAVMENNRSVLRRCTIGASKREVVSANLEDNARFKCVAAYVLVLSQNDVAGGRDARFRTEHV